MTQVVPETAGTADEKIATVEQRPQSGAHVLITEQDVVLSTAAARAAAPVGHRRGTRIMAAIGHFRIRLPEPRTVYPRRESYYFEATRMARMMDHL